ncbi:hypothetical protein PT974_10744 [Cladobotryum mycophilum]|uniref:RlpA-like protein double-psi beta-barrel domain-containing protein n=1 Tax=Cladobotryum mycophilum TaxID=491253 RepID=A0ABR0SAS8_9HYPO
MPSFKIVTALLALAFTATAAPVAEEPSFTIEAAQESGDLTYFTPGLGACGWQSKSSDYIVAISSQIWANRGHCGKHIKVHYGSRTIDVTVVDECPGCSAGSLDLSPSAFQAVVGSLGPGRVHATWNWA